MRNRAVFVWVALVVAVALITGSVLLIGFAAAAASVLIVLTMLANTVIRRESIAATESFVPRRVEAQDAEAA